MLSLRTRLHQWWCSHAVFIENIRRRTDGKVEAPCCRCGKHLVADYGLALDTKLQRRAADPELF